MAELKGGVFGSIKGKVGKVVARNMNGKTFLSERPSSYKQTNSLKAKSVRGKFAVTIQFAKYINNITELSNVWKKARIKGSSSYHRLIKYNSSKIEENSPSIQNIITPDGLSFYPKDVILSKNNLRLSFSTQSINEVTDKFTSLSIFIIFLFRNPLSKKLSRFILKDASLTNINIAEIKNGGLIVPLTQTITQSFNEYQNVIIYSASIFSPEVYKETFWSSTYAKEINLPLQ